MQPPRALWVTFQLGRPLGAPDDPALQTRVLRATLRLLEAKSGPVLEDYPALSNFDVYMSGPPAMIAACRGAFLLAGLPEDRLYYDSFDFAPDVLAKLIHARKQVSR